MSKEISEKQMFIGKYLDKKMKNHGLDGMAYYGLLSKMEDKAEKAWDRKQKRNTHNQQVKHN